MMLASKRWSLALFVLIAILSLGLLACGPRDAEPAPDPDPVENTEPEELPRLTIAVATEVQGTDPQQVRTVMATVHNMLFTPPMSVGLNNDATLPWGASAVEVSEDGLEWRFTFNSGVTFHNAEPVSAEAFKNSLDRYNVTGPYRSDYDAVKEFVVEGDTVVFKMAEPAPGMVAVLGTSYAAPVEVGAAEVMGEETFNREAIGSGPFSLVEWMDGSHILMKRNEDYKDFLPFVDNSGPFHFSEVMVRFIPDAFTRVEEIRAGNVDMITDVPPEALDELRNDPDVEVQEYLNSNVRYMQMNLDRFPFHDKAVREAVALALDRQELQSDVGGAIEPVHGLVGPAMLNYDPEAEARFAQRWGNDDDRARGLLEGAGWTEGSEGIMTKDGERLTFTLVFAGDNPIDSRGAPIIQDQLSRVGMDVELREYDTAYTRELIRDVDFDMILRNGSWIDPGGVWYYGLHSSARLPPWSAPDLDAMLDQVLYIADEEERVTMWTQISERVWDDVAIVPLWTDRLFTATRSNLTGLKMSISGAMYFHDVRLE